MCVKAVRETLTPMDGVADLKVIFAEKRATFKADPKKFDSNKALELLATAGFEGASVE